MDWEKEYTNGNKNCVVRIWDKEKQRMISKEDCGGSLTEVEGMKGQASNGFKRVCALGWGLGIELYSQPPILVPKTDNNVVYDDKGLISVSERYAVQTIEYDDDKQIVRCVIVDSDGRVVYDGPSANGGSNVTPLTNDPDDEPIIIPEDADAVEGSDIDCDDELPDNTDGFDDAIEEFDTQPTPFGNVDYKKEFESEIKRTHVKKADVLRRLNIESIDDLGAVSEELLDETLRKLKAMKSFAK
jgi:hypothetical protein